MKLHLSSIAGVITLGFALSACGGESENSAPSSTPLIAKSFEIKLNAAPGRPAAGYGTIMGPANAMLTGVSSSEAGRIELHIIERDGDMAKMKKVDGLLIESTDSLTLAPGQAHLMLFDLAEGAADDGIVPLTLTFDSGASLSVDAQIAN